MATPTGGFQVAGVRLDFYGYTALDDRNQMRGGDVVQDVTGNGPVDAADDQVAVKRLAVRDVVLDASRYGEDLDVSSRGVAKRLGPGAGDLQFPDSGPVRVEEAVQVVKLNGIGVDERNLRRAHTGESFRHQGADAAEADDADSHVLDVLLCANAPGGNGAALKRVVFEAV